MFVQLRWHLCRCHLYSCLNLRTHKDQYWNDKKITHQQIMKNNLVTYLPNTLYWILPRVCRIKLDKVHTVLSLCKQGVTGFTLGRKSRKQKLCPYVYWAYVNYFWRRKRILTQSSVCNFLLEHTYTEHYSIATAAFVDIVTGSSCIIVETYWNGLCNKS